MRNLKRMFLGIVAVIVVSCVGGGSSSYVDPNNGNIFTLGVTNTNASIYSSSSVFNVSSNNSTTGVVGITTGNANYTGTISFSVVPALGVNKPLSIDSSVKPTITTVPATCTLSSSATAGNICQLIISGNNALAGSYIVTPTIVNGSESLVLNKIQIEISATAASNSPGYLIAALNRNSVTSGDKISGIIALSDSIGISGVKATITNNSPTIIEVSESSACTLSTINNYCDFEIVAKKNGTGTFVISAPGYDPIDINVVVSNSPKVGYLVLQLSSKNVKVGGHVSATAKLVGDRLADSVKVDFTSTKLGTSVTSDAVKIDRGYCTITAPAMSCSVDVTAESANTALDINAIPDKTSGYQQNSSDILTIFGIYLYVDNVTNGTIYAYLYNTDGSLTSLGSQITSTNLANLSNPGTMQINATGDYLYVLNKGALNISVFKINTNGTLDFGSNSAQVLGAPSSIFYDGVSNSIDYLSANLPNLGIYKINESNGSLDNIINEANGIETPSSVATSTNDAGDKLIYVTDSEANQIVIYKVDMSHNSIVLESSVSNGLNTPQKIVVNPINPDIFYVANQGSVSIYQKNGNNLYYIGSGLNPSNNFVKSLFVTPNGKYLYATDINNIIKFTLSDSGVIISTGENVFSSGGSYLAGAACDPYSKFIYINNSSFNQLKYFQILDSGDLVEKGQISTGQNPNEMVFN